MATAAIAGLSAAAAGYSANLSNDADLANLLQFGANAGRVAHLGTEYDEYGTAHGISSEQYLAALATPEAIAASLTTLVYSLASSSDGNSQQNAPKEAYDLLAGLAGLSRFLADPLGNAGGLLGSIASGIGGFFGNLFDSIGGGLESLWNWITGGGGDLPFKGLKEAKVQGAVLGYIEALSTGKEMKGEAQIIGDPFDRASIVVLPDGTRLTLGEYSDIMTRQNPGELMLAEGAAGSGLQFRLRYLWSDMNQLNNRTESRAGLNRSTEYPGHSQCGPTSLAGALIDAGIVPPQLRDDFSLRSDLTLEAQIIQAIRDNQSITSIEAFLRVITGNSADAPLTPAADKRNRDYRQLYAMRGVPTSFNGLQGALYRLFGDSLFALDSDSNTRFADGKTAVAYIKQDGRSPEEFQSFLQENWNNRAEGSEAILFTRMTGSGHFVRLEEVRQDGIVINDPYGYFENGSYLRNDNQTERSARQFHSWQTVSRYRIGEAIMFVRPR